ncbi:hypothetical protein JAAARDRAFT_603457 [Jaapia argillacea MUCL 33604]|uniref:Restriction endonuclease type IV Mrr domain-containing protein n=1 Tax=Jaapia argillacea MUCL 33604 TaxID=933084 RepID=A0A067Q027_9AGAM|nr:hypothetical protein JAAARDRAFT_603457 [Jaapia argillacea MUCL 33604]
MRVTPAQMNAVQLSTVHRGTAFEERSRRVLQTHLSMSLRRVGGKSDGGIDLLGWWWLPHTSTSLSPCVPNGEEPPRRRIRVLGQCKAEKKKFSPNFVREMEGVLYRYLTQGAVHPAEDPTPQAESLSHPPASPYPLVALLISQSPFTSSTLLRALSSPVPFFLLHLPVVEPGPLPQDPAQSDIGMAVWNPALSGERGLLQGQIEIRWERSPSGMGRPGLWFQGRRLNSWTPAEGTVGATLQDDPLPIPDPAI